MSKGICLFDQLRKAFVMIPSARHVNWIKRQLALRFKADADAGQFSVSRNRDMLIDLVSIRPYREELKCLSISVSVTSHADVQIVAKTARN